MKRYKPGKRIFYLLIFLSVLFLLSLCPLRLRANTEAGLDYLKKGVSLWDIGLLGQAEDEFQKEGDFYHLSLSEYRLATYYLISGKNEEARKYAEKGIKNVRKAIKQNNDFASSYTVLGNLYGILVGVSDNPLIVARYGFLCMKNLKKAIRMEPENSFALLSLGIAYFNTPVKYGGGLDKAEAMFDRAIKSDRRNSEAYIWLSKCYIKRGEVKKAKGFLRKALDYDAENRWAKNILTGLEKKNKGSIRGRIADIKTGEDLSWVNVIVEGTKKGSISDDNGNFFIRGIEKGKHKLRFKRIGYEDVLKEVDVNSENVPICISMKQSVVAIQGITVKANPVYDRKQKGEEIITPVELWRLPGSGAELFWGLKSLPGVSGGDIAPIVVRGGNPKENITLLDGIRLKHPFHLESLAGGLVSFFEPSVLSSVTFISGGFGAKYGDGLASVVDVRTRNPRSSLGGRCSVSLANGYIDIEGNGFPNMNYLILLRGGTTYLISNLSKSQDSFEIFPQYYDLFSKIIYQANHSSKFELLGIGNSDIMEPRIDDSHTYLSKSNQKIISVSNRTLYKDGILRVRISFVDFIKREEIEGYYRNDSRDRNLDCKGSFERSVGLHRIETGSGFVSALKGAKGSFPDDSLRFLNSSSGIVDYYSNLCGSRMFYYIQDEFRIKRRITFVPGLRIEHFTQNRETVFDPRFTLAYLLVNNTTLKFSTGIYHQTVQSASNLFNRKLQNEKSCHYVLGIERRLRTGRFRMEGFYKNYNNLPLKEKGDYSSEGYGYVRGFDVLYQSGVGFLKGLIVYSFTDSKRKEMDADSPVTSSYEIPHSFTFSVTGDLLPYFSFGVKYRYHTGRVYTPVLYGKYDEGKEEWVPVLGECNSMRFPPYKRVDVQFSKIVSVRNNGIVLFAECENLFNSRNIVRYYYSEDFNDRQPVIIMTRTVVAGFMLYF